MNFHDIMVNDVWLVVIIYVCYLEFCIFIEAAIEKYALSALIYIRRDREVVLPEPTVFLIH